ncbi:MULTISPECIES: hypothetical protein [Ignavibacterium]|uniref:hypothetical protein n=1 Tax=Ignavibacterium TaxID=795750 RepID=UPI0025C3640D|nr:MULTISPECIES: hypothetical protein [Ignavibacterium]MBI5660844.1 hypothetical protein [Ignavibacterium album]
MSINLKLFVIVFIFMIVVLALQSCEMNDIDGNKYYKGKFIDEIFIVKESDTINIIIEQFQKWPFQKDSIPYSFDEKKDSSDLIALKLFVSFGSYSQLPKVNKEVYSIMDTILIWYDSYVWISGRDVLNKSLYKNHSDNLITDISTAPKLEYLIIDSIVIHKSIYKAVSINTSFKVYQ